VLSRALPSLVLVACLAAGCSQHTTVIRSSPPGADVYVEETDFEDDGVALRHLGRTPYRLKSDYGWPTETQRLVVARDEEAVAFTLTRGQLTLDSVLTSSVGTGVSFVLCGGVAAATGVGGLLVLPFGPWFSAPLWCTSACCGGIALWQPISCGLNMWAGPDDVNIVFGRETTSTPDGLIKDEGPVDVPRPEDVLPDEPELAPPPDEDEPEVLEVAF
jgi:hypothetical protein